MTELNFETMRRAMVSSQLRTSAVSDPRVVAAMGAVPRELFVPAARAGVAYVDTVIPLGGGRALNPPMALGRLLTEAGVRADDRALLIGAATGYGAAVLGRLVASVVAIEEDPALLATARAVPLPANVQLIEASLAAGWADGAPYDLIIIDGAIEAVPPAILAQLGKDGRLGTGLAERGVTRLASGRKGGGGFGLVAFADAEVAILPGFAKPATFQF